MKRLIAKGNGVEFHVGDTERAMLERLGVHESERQDQIYRGLADVALRYEDEASHADQWEPFEAPDVAATRRSRPEEAEDL